MVASAIPASNHAQAQTKHYGDIWTWSFGCRPNHSDCPEAHQSDRLELVGRIDTALVRARCYLCACNRNDYGIPQEQDLTGRDNTRPLFYFRARVTRIGVYTYGNSKAIDTEGYPGYI